MVRYFLLTCIMFLSACSTVSPTPTPTKTRPPTAVPSTPTLALQDTFPHGINPLTGLPAADRSLLRIPALLISISHFPATARPQSGLSFAPYVYEYYITEGATRFLAVFYGEFPVPDNPVEGGCVSRPEPFVQTATLLGNRVWLDANANGVQDPGEQGVDGVCVNLYDANGHLIQRTSTDTNGYYGFNVKPGHYEVEVVKPAGLVFTQAHTGEAGLDSDVDPHTGRAEVDIASDDLAVDAGLVPSSLPAATPTPQIHLPVPQVGPIRSGRLIYRYIGKYFQNSCLIYAGASSEELAVLPQCYMVFHTLSGGGYMLDLDEMHQVALDNLHKEGSNFNYVSNTFSEEPPPGGTPASRLNVFIAYQNQSAWVYDPLYQAYLRYVDTSEYDLAGVLHPDKDRLTLRQLHFENVIVLYAEHEVVSPTNLDIHLNPGRAGSALLFRDGQVFQIRWSTRDSDHPIAFIDQNGNSIPLKPGHTWILVVTPDSTVQQKAQGEWQLTFAQPPGAK